MDLQNKITKLSSENYKLKIQNYKLQKQLRMLKKKLNQKTKSSPSPANLFYCSECPATFSSLDAYEKHRSKGHLAKLQCEICSRVFRIEKNFQEHQIQCANGTIELLTCSLCPKTMYGKNELQKHMKNAHSGRRFPCDVCSKNFVSHSSLVRHVKEVHERKYEVTCRYCHKKINLRNIKDHQRRLHPQEKEPETDEYIEEYLEEY